MPIPTDENERLELGRRVHQREWSSMEMAAANTGVPVHQLYTLQREYRIAAGIPVPESRGGRAGRTGPEDETPAERKRRRDNERHRAKRAEAKAARDARKLNGNGHALPIVRGDNGEDRLDLQYRIKELEQELQRAMDEVHTLQKILMVVGERL